MLHSYHTAPVRMVSGSGEVSYVRWYKCAPGAKPLPFPTAFGSAVWDSALDDNHPPVGMQGPIPALFLKEPCLYQWAPTRYPAPDGQHWHGEPQWFLTGIPPEVIRPGPREDLCGVPLIDGDGGIDTDGSGDIDGQRAVLIQGGGDLVQDGRATVSISVLTTDKATISPIMPVTGSLFLPDATCMLLTLPIGSTLTGFTGGTPGRLIWVEMVGGYPFYVLNQSSTSPPSERVIGLLERHTYFTQGQGRLYQYDGAATRWREVSSVPLVSQPGELLTADDTGPTTLPVSPLSQQVLTAQPSLPTKIGWGDGSGGAGGAGDLNYPVQRNPTTEIGERWYLTTSFPPTTGSPSPVTAEVIYLQPWLCPSGHRLNGMACVVELAGGVNDRVILGIYEESGSGDLLPNSLVASTNAMTVGTATTVIGAINFRPTPGKLYWLAFLFHDIAHTAQFRVFLTPPTTWQPFLGFPPGLHDFPPTFWARYVNWTWSGMLPDPCPRPVLDPALLNPVPRVGVRFNPS